MLGPANIQFVNFGITLGKHSLFCTSKINLTKYAKKNEGDSYAQKRALSIDNTP